MPIAISCAVSFKLASGGSGKVHFRATCLSLIQTMTSSERSLRRPLASMVVGAVANGELAEVLAGEHGSS